MLGAYSDSSGSAREMALELGRSAELSSKSIKQRMAAISLRMAVDNDALQELSSLVYATGKIVERSTVKVNAAAQRREVPDGE